VEDEDACLPRVILWGLPPQNVLAAGKRITTSFRMDAFVDLIHFNHGFAHWGSCSLRGMDAAGAAAARRLDGDSAVSAGSRTPVTFPETTRSALSRRVCRSRLLRVFTGSPGCMRSVARVLPTAWVIQGLDGNPFAIQPAVV